ncbi:CheR family methyltransferase [Sporosalibacterium faouarense]|uniref:CheR family methyltransferase n=1 Tax=Sporosalibacterium faouarense TaxID=516123 RepID=UPI00141D446A|nr:protein-glutamate O-methyltransferase CheR [Sporosalibacterium faouarense]MTI48144.1 protein-glutamate O-methyltransferase CheR [Bacillota bacterium]
MDKYEIFKDNVYKLIGINLSCYKEKQMKRRINSLIGRNNYSDFDDYFKGLKTDEKLLSEFVNYLTINVSEFYRNPSQWEVIEKEIIPVSIEKHSNLKIWSSACSTGEEPYSMVMLLSKFFPLNKIKILATDIDKGAIEKAKIGVYNEKSVQNLPKEFVSKYFKRIGNTYKIDDSIKKCVEFKELNLLEDNYPRNTDLILCRNVMIYFTEEAKNIMYKKFYDSLNKEGILFVGSTEQIILPDRFNLKSVRTFFYKKSN